MRFIGKVIKYMWLSVIYSFLLVSAVTGAVIICLGAGFYIAMAGEILHVPMLPFK